MAEFKKITSLYVVTDTEYNQEQVGDIQGGGFDKDWLKNHIKIHGTNQILKTIAYMSFQVIEAVRENNSESNHDVHIQVLNKKRG